MHPLIRTVVSLALLGLLLPSCSSDGGDPAGSNPPVVNLSVHADSPAPTTLGTQVTFPVTLTSTGFSGPVALRVTGAPASWLIVVADSALVLTVNGNAATTVTVTIPSTGEPADSGDTLRVEAVSSLGVRTAVTVLTVANEYVVPISGGAGSGPHWGVHGGTLLRLNIGTRLTIRNDDTTGHNIHTDGSIPGFPHQNSSLVLGHGETYSNILGGAGTDAFYCHTHGQGTGVVNLVVQ